MANLNDHRRDTDSEVRKHYYLNKYVVIAPARNKRPQQLGHANAVSEKTSSHHAIEDNLSIYEVPGPDNTDWSVKVVANRYPAFSATNAHARGEQEVVLETPKTSTPFHKLSVAEITGVLLAYQHRVRELSGRYAYVSVFKNQGANAGASLDYTHSQIIATEMIPTEVQYDRTALTEYQDKHQTSALCDVVRWELAERQRVVAHTRHMTTICPYASQFPLEAWIIPNRQARSLADLRPEEISSLADHLKGVVLALSSNGIDFNYHFQESIPDTTNHLFLKIIPRISVQAGYELNTGVYINSVSPEFAVKWYQKHIKTPDVG